MAGPSSDRRSVAAHRFARELIGLAFAGAHEWHDASLGPLTLRLGLRTRDDLADLIRGAFLAGDPGLPTVTLAVARHGEFPRLPRVEWARGWIEAGSVIPDNITRPYRIFIDRQAGVIYAMDTESGQGAVWVRRTTELDLRSFITPFRLMLSWLAGTVDGEIVHASGAVVDRVGLLFSGPSGSGKSTTAIALGMRGHQLIADDCLLVHDGVMHAVFARAKMDRRTQEMLGASSLQLSSVRGTPRAKDFIRLSDLGASFTSAAPLGALVFPRLAPTTGVVRWPADRARESLTADSLREVFGGTPRSRLRLGQIASRFPAYRVLLGSDVEGNARLLEGLAADMGTSHPPHRG